MAHTNQCSSHSVPRNVLCVVLLEAGSAGVGRPTEYWSRRTMQKLSRHMLLGRLVGNLLALDPAKSSKCDALRWSWPLRPKLRLLGSGHVYTPSQASVIAGTPI